MRGRRVARGKAPTRASEPGVNTQSVLKLFSNYASGEQIDGEGIGKMSQELAIDPMTDVAMLVLLWKCGTETPGVITKEEFLRGCQSLSIETLDGLKQKLPELRQVARDFHSQDFKNFFKFVFMLSKEPGSRVLDVEDAVSLINVLLSGKVWWMDDFIKFIREKGVRALNLDQWDSLLEFAKNFPEGFENFDPDGPWPVLFDEFVQWVKTNH